jgi:hypothetical protein
MKITAKIINNFFWTEYRYEFGNNIIHRANRQNRRATALTKRMKEVLIENQS